MSQERRTRPVRATVAEKRRASERLKEEPASKRRDSGTPKSARLEKARLKNIKAPTPEAPAKQEEVIVLPSRVVEGQSLPTLREPQPKDLSDSEFKSIAESGVIAASVERSRKNWMGDMFELYWSGKNKKKKNATEEDKKAEAERKAEEKSRKPHMPRIGACKMIVEPHIFDIELFTAKDTASQPNNTANQQFVQYGPQYTAPNPPAPGFASSPYRPSPLQQAPAVPAHQDTPRPTSQASQPLPPSQSSQNTPAPTVSQNGNAAQRDQAPTPQAQSQGNSKPQAQPQTQREAVKQDPVIHMLAQRAATDQELKQVMTIVATGKASPQQLEFFQRHIDELTKIARKNEEAERKRNELKAAPPATAARPVQPPAAPIRLSQTTNGHHQTASAATSRPSTPSQNQPSTQQQPPLQPQPQPRPPHPNQYTYQHSAPKPPKPVPAFSNVVLEFKDQANVRYLFPRYSILEYLPGFKSCICSFLVVRKFPTRPPDESSAPASGTKKAKKEVVEEKEVYQPVTVKFSAADTQTLAILAKVVAPQEEVRQYMEDVMARAERAKEGVLAWRLPRRKGGFGMDGVEDS